MKKSFKITAAFLLVLFIGIVVVRISKQMALDTAERTMRPYKGVTEYYHSSFRPIGYFDGLGPTWLFYYDSPTLFDAARFTVAVDFIGRLRNVYPERVGLWDRREKRWIMIPSDKGPVPVDSGK